MSNKEFIQEQIKKIEIILKDNKNVFSKEMKSLYEDDLKHYNQILKDLDRLEKIDNVNPSEAIDRLEYICKILNEKRIDIKWLFKNDYNTIKQALLKAQEQDKILEILKPRIYIEEGLYREDFQDDRLKFDKDFFDSAEQENTIKEWLK